MLGILTQNFSDALTYGKARYARPTSLEIPVGYNRRKVLYLNHKRNEGVKPNASFMPKKEYRIISVKDQLSTKDETRKWVRISGKLYKTPHTKNSLDSIWGSVADIGDLTKPTRE